MNTIVPYAFESGALNFREFQYNGQKININAAHEHTNGDIVTFTEKHFYTRAINTVINVKCEKNGQIS